MKSILKNNIKFFLGFLIGGIMFGGIGIYAATSLSFASGDVDHTKTDGTKTNVKDALNDLYLLAENNSKPVSTHLIGSFSTGNATGDATIDISSKYENFKKITADNIIIVPKSMSFSADRYSTTNSGQGVGISPYLKSYDSNTGKITVGNNGSYSAGGMVRGFCSTIEVYVFS